MSTPLDNLPEGYFEFTSERRITIAGVDDEEAALNRFKKEVDNLDDKGFAEANFAQMLFDSGLTANRVTGAQAKNALAEIDLLDDGTYLGSTNKPAPNGQPTSRGNDLPDH